MLYYDRIDVSKELIFLKVMQVKNAWFATIVFRFNFGFKLQDPVCNSCNDLTIISINVSDIANMAVKNVDYRSNIRNIRKSEVINLSKSAVLENCGYI